MKRRDELWQFARSILDDAARRRQQEQQRGRRVPGYTPPRVLPRNVPINDAPPSPPPSRYFLRDQNRGRRRELVQTTIDEFLPGNIVGESAAAKPSNFYILPAGVLDFFRSIRVIYTDAGEIMVDLVKLYHYFQNIKETIDSDSDTFVAFYKKSDRQSNPEGYIENEIKKLLSFRYTDDILSYFQGYDSLRPVSNLRSRFTGPQLVIPFADVYDLPVDLLIYILYCLSLTSQLSRSRKIFSAQYIWSDDETEQTANFLREPNNRNIVFSNKKVSIDIVNRIYMALIKSIGLEFGERGANSELTWNGSEGSGVRIMLLHMGKFNMYLTLVFIAAHSQQIPGKWTRFISEFVEKLNETESCVITVKNERDNKCLLYCIILGLFIEMLNRRVVFPGTEISDFAIFSKASMWTKSILDSDTSSFTPVQLECIKLIHTLSKYLLPVAVSGDDDDDTSIRCMVEDIDSKVTMMLSIDDFRFQMEDIEKKLIPSGVCGIDVYGIDENVNKHVYPLYISKNRGKNMQLLCITPKDSETSHYCLILNMKALMKNSGGKQFFSCSKCGAAFYSRKMLQTHQYKCILGANDDLGYHWSNAEDERNKVSLPEEGFCSKCRLKFLSVFEYQYHKAHCFMEGKTGYRHVRLIQTEQEGEPCMLHGEDIDMKEEEKHIKQSRVMYADFESSIDPESGLHSFMSFGIYDWKGDKYLCGYTLDEFWKFILDSIVNNSEDRVYVYFHNAMNYDANFILRFVLQKIKDDDPIFRNWGIKTIMKSTNRLQKLVFYVDIPGTKGKRKSVHIGDTFLFLTLSLERIVGSIRKDNLDENESNFPRFFKVFHRLYPEVSPEEIDHILRKNIFPYRFFTDSSKLNTPIAQFLSIFEPKPENLEYFSEKVGLEDLSKGYEDTKHVIETFKCKDARAYHDLYLVCDVIQLADVFDRSMKILWETHHIHLTRYIGMPSAAWAAFLRHDPTMKIPLYQSTFYAEFFKGMIRGGITSAALRYAEADERHSIIYLDVNGLYPYVMQAYEFPCGQFSHQFFNWKGEECRAKLFELFDSFERSHHDGSIHRGGCFCVDMHIPDEVKMLTDEYPFAPEHRQIFDEYFTGDDDVELTPFLKRWSEANDGDTMKEFNGLVCTLYDKENYNVHWRLLKFYMEHGIEITAVHFGVFFDEGDYLAGYVRTNIEIRNGRKDELGKTVYKLLGNAVYGKTFESPFKRNTFDIVTNETRLQGLIDESAISSMTPIDDLGWIVRRDGEEILLDKPTYIGACVCEYAKLHMYTLLYDKMKKIFPGEDGCHMVYIDTDSFILLVSHPPELSDTKKLFEYIKEKDPTLIGGIGGQVKSETGYEDTIQKVIALRSKVYSYVTKKGKIGKRAKGTTYDAQELQLDWETYENTLYELTSYNTRNTLFQRKVFTITTSDVERRSLSVNDGKRYICEDGIHTHAFGFLPPLYFTSMFN